MPDPKGGGRFVGSTGIIDGTVVRTSVGGPPIAKTESGVPESVSAEEIRGKNAYGEPVFPFSAPPSPNKNAKSIYLSRDDSGFLRINADDYTGLDVTGSFTIETWVKFRSMPNIGEVIGIGGTSFVPGGGDTTYGFGLENDSAEGPRLRLLLSDDGTTERLVYANVDVTASVWHHFGVAFSSGTAGLSNKCLFTKDGSQLTVSETSGSDLTSISAGTADSHYFVNAGQTFDDGDIYVDEMRVWNTARSEEQISGSMDKVIDPTTKNLQAYWRFEKLSNDGFKTPDLTENANEISVFDAVLTGTVPPVFPRI